MTKLTFFKSRPTRYLLVLALTLSYVFILSSPAGATSAFDGVVDKARTLKISGSNGSCTNDISTTWLSLLQQASVGGPQFPYQSQYVTDAYNQLVENMSAGSGWGLWEMKYQGKYSVQLVIFPPETDFVFEYTPSGTPVPILNGYHSSPEDVYFIEMSMYDCSYPKYTVRGPAWEAVGEYPDHISYQNFDNPSNISYMVETKIFFINYDSITYPTGYDGETIPTSNAWADLDGDGLIASEESSQGTSNASKDTDGDGIDDFKESVWFEDRDDIFCGTSQCAYPNPTEKDVYVEIDWMKDFLNRVYKPSGTQLDLVIDMFEAKGINFHADVGQFGGGNELPAFTETLAYTPTTSYVDYYDYRNGGDGISANFSDDRNSIWRYMIYGYNYLEDTTSTGWAKVMGSDLFVSGGLIEDMSGLVSMDRAVANTMAHEIGHALCLSDEQVFAEQPLECVYEAIDNGDNNSPYYNLANYQSVMNYRYQLTDQDDIGVVDYSDGSHGTGDHNDWGGVMLGMDGFSGARTLLGAKLAAKYVTMPDGSVIIQEETPGYGENGTEFNKTPIYDNPAPQGRSPTENNNTTRADTILNPESHNSGHDRTFLWVIGGILLMLASIGIWFGMRSKKR